MDDTNGGSNSYLVNPNTRVHQFTTSGTFTLPGPPLATDGSIVRAQSNTTIKVNRLTINNPNNANVRCNVWYRNERNNTNTYIVFNRFISANSSVTLIDKNNPVYVANLSALVGSYQTGVGF
ncbi:hypothetical protein EBU95_20765 [bacterium]|nr:hypothetical protein [bacterium]